MRQANPGSELRARINRGIQVMQPRRRGPAEPIKQRAMLRRDFRNLSRIPTPLINRDNLLALELAQPTRRLHDVGAVNQVAKLRRQLGGGLGNDNHIKSLVTRLGPRGARQNVQNTLPRPGRGQRVSAAFIGDNQRIQRQRIQPRQRTTHRRRQQPKPSVRKRKVMDNIAPRPRRLQSAIQRKTGLARTDVSGEENNHSEIVKRCQNSRMGRSAMLNGMTRSSDNIQYR